VGRFSHQWTKILQSYRYNFHSQRTAADLKESVPGCLSLVFVTICDPVWIVFVVVFVLVWDSELRPDSAVPAVSLVIFHSFLPQLNSHKKNIGWITKRATGAEPYCSGCNRGIGVSFICCYCYTFMGTSPLNGFEPPNVIWPQ